MWGTSQIEKGNKQATQPETRRLQRALEQIAARETGSIAADDEEKLQNYSYIGRQWLPGG
jgi:hypothetical protein